MGQFILQINTIGLHRIPRFKDESCQIVPFIRFASSPVTTC